MDGITIVKKTNKIETAGPLLVDGLAFLLILWLLPELITKLELPSVINAAWLVGFYILFMVCVYLVQKLMPVKALEGEMGRRPFVGRPFVRVLLNRKVRGVLALIFSLGMMTALAYQFGYFDSVFLAGPRQLDEGESAALFVFGPGAWLGLCLIYILVLASDFTPTVEPGTSRYTGQSLVGLLGINLMLMVTTAQCQIVAAGLGWNGNLVWFLLAFMLMILLFAPTRLIYLLKRPYWPAALSYLFLLGYCAWQVGG